MAEDAENNVANQVAPDIQNTQSEQASATESADQSPVETPTDNGEPLILGKFKSYDDLAKSYQELESKFTRDSQQRNEPASKPAPVPPMPVYTPPPPTQGAAPFDPETQQALTAWYAAQREAEWRAEEERRVADFERRHASELEDRLLRATLVDVIQEHNRTSGYIDHETALSEAKEILEKRISGTVKKVEKEAFEEGQQTALNKTKAAAVGDTSTASPAVDPEKMSAKDYAAFFGLSRQ